MNMNATPRKRVLTLTRELVCLCVCVLCGVLCG
jgi:hypothetical protein